VGGGALDEAAKMPRTRGCRRRGVRNEERVLPLPVERVSHFNGRGTPHHHPTRGPGEAL